MVVVPKLPPASNGALSLALAVAIGGSVLLANFVALRAGLEMWSATVADIRPRAEAAGALIAAGAPAVDSGRIEMWQARGLNVTE